ncbi:MAG: FAD-dependent oxidoreductase [Elusimicrobia bacterium]|nr:FAD-dependent oxidoreductase [Elusimicrobiota bacterium]
MSQTIILGGGLAGLSLASFLERECLVLEKEDRLGGLSRSFDLNGVAFDIGPHIMFSKNQRVLDLHTRLVETNRLRRSNQIFHEGRLIKYPFENDLGSLPPGERDYCLKEFLDNPYAGYPANNMLQFFMKTFGEGITRTYLQPYNEKIWKFDPAFMDTQMVERIPKPPREDVIKSANGVPTEGYLHQLYFHYPKKGGYQSLVDAYAERARRPGPGARRGARIEVGTAVQRVEKAAGGWRVTTARGVFEAEELINCMPLHELFRCLDAPAEIVETVGRLRYNSIYIIVLQVKRDAIGGHFALYFADKGVLFHRASKLDFLGETYRLRGGGSTLLLEVTYRPDSYLSTWTADAVRERAIDDLARLGLIEKGDVLDSVIQSHRYAYPIYDLDHRRNTGRVLAWLKGMGIRCSGRFAEFEYLNTDAVAEHALALAEELNGAEVSL